MKLPLESVCALPSCPPLTPLLMAYALTVAPLTGPLVAVPLIVPVVTDVLALRGHGTTDLTGALFEAGRQLSRSRAGRKIAVLLSDCRQTEDGDVEAAAGALDELVIIAPDGDDDEARALAGRIGARSATVSGPSDVPRAIAAVLDRG